MKRQAGYAPTHGPNCQGPGDTCQSACGAEYAQCPSDDGQTYCFIPSKGSCCTDGSGRMSSLPLGACEWVLNANGVSVSCDNGYYCTQDNTGGTWCCPDVRRSRVTYL
jgi:hypothetical protein